MLQIRYNNLGTYKELLPPPPPHTISYFIYMEAPKVCPLSLIPCLFPTLQQKSLYLPPCLQFSSARPSCVVLSTKLGPVLQ